MKYEEMFNEYIKYIGVSENNFKKYIIENKLDDTDGTNIYFDLVVTPYLIDQIKCNNNELIIKSFDFIEVSLNDNNRDIVSLVEFSLLEGLISEIGEKINEFKGYFGDKTKKSIDSIKKYIIC